MRILNHTSIDDEVLKAMTSIVTRGYTRNIGQVVFKHMKGLLCQDSSLCVRYSGVCLYGCSFNKARLIVRVDPRVAERLYPFVMNERHNQYYPRYEIRDQLELVLAILAHEFAHLRLNLRGTKNTQVRCERYAVKVLEQFRQKFWNEGKMQEKTRKGPDRFSPQ
jgi:hypothetical protein